MNVHDIRIPAANAGADFFGIADLSPAYEAILEQGGEAIAGFPRAVSVGVRLPDSIVDLLPQRSDADTAVEYKRVYDEVNRTLDLISSRIAEHLESAGATASAVPASRITDRDRLCGLFSHKMAAQLAGLGWIGKSCLLITPEAGPRARWATVLTDAALEPTGGGTAQACGKCRQCVDACPARAFTGKPFRSDEDRDLRFAVRRCETYLERMKERLGCHILCGLCVSVCPHGRPGSARKTAADDG